jgi:hypothetical protein
MLGEAGKTLLSAERDAASCAESTVGDIGRGPPAGPAGGSGGRSRDPHLNRKALSS